MVIVDQAANGAILLRCINTENTRSIEQHYGDAVKSLTGVISTAKKLYFINLIEILNLPPSLTTPIEIKHEAPLGFILISIAPPGVRFLLIYQFPSIMSNKITLPYGLHCKNPTTWKRKILAHWQQKPVGGCVCVCRGRVNSGSETLLIDITVHKHTTFKGSEISLA